LSRSLARKSACSALEVAKAASRVTEVSPRGDFPSRRHTQ